ncbi:MAG: metabolite traffic protein EboE [Planctomycetes bacterium]|nr:metabolite traffic protein EboE [Planctomycetota bacterium]
MILRRGAGEILLGYSTNLWRAEDPAALERSLRGFAGGMRRRLRFAGPLGLALHIGEAAANSLARRPARARVAALLADLDLRLFAVNAFPLRAFHTRRVKEKAYDPPWTSPDRERVTIRIARIAHDLAPEGAEISISTLAGTFRPWGDDPRTRGAIASRLIRVARALDGIRRRTGRTIRLALEPEPWTTLETAGDAARFWDEHLLPAARGDEAIVRRHIAVNLDAAHGATLFHRPAGEIARLRRAGIRLASLHLANALEIRRPGRSPRALREWLSFAEPRYLHQWCAADARGRVAARILDLRPPTRSERRAAAFRVHFHVPLFRARLGRLRTTRDETRAALRAAVRGGATRHLVMETYTWPLLAPTPERLLDGMAREYRWVLGELADLGWRPRAR